MAPFVKQGRLKAIAVTGPKRLAALPDKPTLVEGGIRFDAVGWHGAFVAAATPPAIVARLNRAFVKALSRPDIRERIITGGSVPIEPAYSAEQWTEKYRKEVAEWAAIARTSGARAD
jgi:tripartite-type tricarboxylate transporter receptor subunit TctC